MKSAVLYYKVVLIVYLQSIEYLYCCMHSVMFGMLILCSRNNNSRKSHNAQSLLVRRTARAMYRCIVLGCCLCESDSELQTMVRSRKQISFVRQKSKHCCFLCEIGNGDGARVICLCLFARLNYFEIAVIQVVAVSGAAKRRAEWTSLGLELKHPSLP